MGRRYFCEYCDKSFVETADAVKKHINGLQHQKLRNEYYIQFEDKYKLLETESRKIPCKRFENGTCMFGATCRYSHYTKQQLNILRWEVEQMDKLRQLQKQHLSSDIVMKDWSASRKKRGLSNSFALENAFIDSLVINNENVSDILDWKYPSLLNEISDLPPSLKKIKLSDFNDNNFAEWG